MGNHRFLHCKRGISRGYHGAICFKTDLIWHINFPCLHKMWRASLLETFPSQKPDLWRSHWPARHYRLCETPLQLVLLFVHLVVCLTPTSKLLLPKWNPVKWMLSMSAKDEPDDPSMWGITATPDDDVVTATSTNPTTIFLDLPVECSFFAPKSADNLRPCAVIVSYEKSVAGLGVDDINNSGLDGPPPIWRWAESHDPFLKRMGLQRKIWRKHLYSTKSSNTDWSCFYLGLSKNGNDLGCIPLAFRKTIFGMYINQETRFCSHKPILIYEENIPIRS